MWDFNRILYFVSIFDSIVEENESRLAIIGVFDETADTFMDVVCLVSVSAFEFWGMLLAEGA